jgi:hypothetical protein
MHPWRNRFALYNHQNPKTKLKWQTIEGMENLLNVWEYAAKNQIELVSNHKLLPNGSLPTNKCILPYAHYTQHKFQNPEPKIEANSWAPKPIECYKPSKFQEWTL